MENTLNFNNWLQLNEDGAGVGGAAGSGDASAAVGGGVAYFNQGTVDGMGAVKNATVSSVPGDPDGSTAGSGDASVYLPAFTYTKNSGITGNTKHKKGKTKINLGEINRVKDELGVGKTMKFKDFINK